ncbi:hypothetical protein [Lederbergia citrea]|uniref:Uncharacterized protein n=1 Tax=Lederbergia citrea TaxID=2833581 RepID=A0A942UNL9_9BACI|nr:hypothetical protein [Lederbergia citrea]MBS4176125.1 hypothetical protein [Lederbergia citrea]MBS4202685.1 hypothetical protein [Lederbergia citrea]MBS4222647.1 hypothetical protein [Lederbergia citrea]
MLKKENKQTRPALASGIDVQEDLNFVKENENNEEEVIRSEKLRYKNADEIYELNPEE